LKGTQNAIRNSNNNNKGEQREQQKQEAEEEAAASKIWNYIFYCIHMGLYYGFLQVFFLCDTNFGFIVCFWLPFFLATFS